METAAPVAPIPGRAPEGTRTRIRTIVTHRLEEMRRDPKQEARELWLGSPFHIPTSVRSAS
jgi:hypothetical protein